jgi:hypothetical protein
MEHGVIFGHGVIDIMVEADIAGDIDEKQNHDGSTQIS